MLEYHIAGLLVASLSVADFIEHQIKHQDDEVVKPVDTVSVIIPALNEEEYIEKCLKSLRNQSIVKQYPEYFEYVVVDNGSTDRTKELARPYADKVLDAPKGKLNARNLGTLYSTGNIVVASDADIVYPSDYLNSLLKPFNNPEIVGVSGSILDDNIKGVPKPLYVIGSFVNRTLMPERMMGGNCAYYKHLFYMTGQFNTDINQQSVNEMVEEEEIGFGKRMSKFGKVKFQLNAYGQHLGGQRVACRYSLESKDKCLKYNIGIERFG